METQFLDKSVVLVGNGSSLLQRGKGPWIDQQDVVVRFNLFQIRRFEQDVGTRTTIWFNNRDAESPQIQARLRNYAFDQIYIHTWQDTSKAVDSFSRQLSLLHIETALSAIDKKMIGEMKTYLGLRYSMFSTGAIGVWMMLQKYRSVCLIGFDWWNSFQQFHYCDNAKFVHSDLGGHQPQLEKRFFEKLAEGGRLLIV